MRPCLCVGDANGPEGPLIDGILRRRVEVKAKPMLRRIDSVRVGDGKQHDVEERRGNAPQPAKIDAHDAAAPKGLDGGSGDRLGALYDRARRPDVVSSADRVRHRLSYRPLGLAE